MATYKISSQKARTKIGAILHAASKGHVIVIEVRGYAVAQLCKATIPQAEVDAAQEFGEPSAPPVPPKKPGEAALEALDALERMLPPDIPGEQHAAQLREEATPKAPPAAVKRRSPNVHADDDPNDDYENPLPDYELAGRELAGREPA